jgi:hypothetical protein
MSDDGNYSLQVMVSPATPLGKVDMSLTAEDEVGHTADSSVRIEAILPPADPAIVTISLEPKNLPNDGKTKCLLEVVTSDVNDDIAQTTADLSNVGGARSVAMKDDGKGADKKSGDDVWSLEFSVPQSVLAGTKKIEVIVTDSTGRTATSSESLRIDQSNLPPGIVSYRYYPQDATVGIGDEFTVFVNASDPEGKISKVDLDLTELSMGTVTLLDDGMDPDTKAGDLTYSGSFIVRGNLSGRYNITIRVTDSSGAQATSRLSITVPPKGGGDQKGISQALYIGAPIGFIVLIVLLLIASTYLSSRRRRAGPSPNPSPVFRPMGQPPSRFVPVSGQGPR